MHAHARACTHTHVRDPSADFFQLNTMPAFAWGWAVVAAAPLAHAGWPRLLARGIQEAGPGGPGADPAGLTLGKWGPDWRATRELPARVGQAGRHGVMGIPASSPERASVACPCCCEGTSLAVHHPCSWLAGARQAPAGSQVSLASEEHQNLMLVQCWFRANSTSSNFQHSLNRGVRRQLSGGLGGGDFPLCLWSLAPPPGPSGTCQVLPACALVPGSNRNGSFREK